MARAGGWLREGLASIRASLLALRQVGEVTLSNRVPLRSLMVSTRATHCWDGREPVERALAVLRSRLSCVG